MQPELWAIGGRSAVDPGPVCARAFHRLLALVSLSAWLSLGTQLDVLVGSHGLLPAVDFFTRAREHGLGVLDVPSWLWLGQSDALLTCGVLLGALTSLLALFGFGTRVAFACNAVLYLGYAIACDTFTSFQWDNMLVEASLLAALLPRDRRAPLATLLLRLLLFKLYFESGIAKWQSQIGDWKDGSAMSYYYETAPLPTWLAWYAHYLPVSVHRLESWAALIMELVVPWFVFGPRALRLIAFAYFGGFLLVDTLTANYGFFTYLAAALQVFLLCDADLERLAGFVRERLPAWFRDPRAESEPAARALPPWAAKLARGALALYACVWIASSLIGAVTHFTTFASQHEAVMRAYLASEPFRHANVYHLFGQITRERIEPSFETEVDGTWVEHPLLYKPGPPTRPPPFVAPHQPRVDFRLWFYGLSFQQGMPRFVRALLDRLCHDPTAVQSLFTNSLPAHAEAARIVFHRYHFTTASERAATGAYWTRESLGATQPFACH
ncbi:MAG TPA: lipase maturation factor family protein [Polyangiales bacterium]|nr:lipase maturation factor family protein [Polyangiales bacterium]